jgi:hypothetical protein
VVVAEVAVADQAQALEDLVAVVLEEMMEQVLMEQLTLAVAVVAVVEPETPTTVELEEKEL